MTLLTTGLTMSSIQTEFGGINPVSISEYVRGGAYVGAGQAISGTDTNAIPVSTASPIRMGMFRGLTKYANGTRIGTGFSSANADVGGGGTAFITFQGDGTIEASSNHDYHSIYTAGPGVSVLNLDGNGNSNSTSYAILQGDAGWLAGSPISSQGAAYWIRARTGPTGGVAVNTWMLVGTGRQWTYDSSTINTVTFFVDISATNGGAILRSYSIDMTSGAI
jgi:hypothetical protein